MPGLALCCVIACVAVMLQGFEEQALGHPYLEALNASERAEFLARYDSAIAAAYPAFADGTVLLPFPRLFIVATR